VTSESELLICDYGGGGLWRLTRNPDADKPADFPRRLSETGLFSDIARQQLSPGVVPYRINAPRWADHATAERWAAFPGNGVVTVAKKELGVMPAGRWVFPTDAVLAKTYSLEMEEGDAATRRRIETQILHFNGQQWAAYSYRWNDAQTDAELVPSRGAEALFKVKDAAHPAGTRQQTWRYFSRAECLRCHNMWDNFAPGFAPVQLNRTIPDPSADQLDLLLPTPAPTPAPEQARLANPHGDGGPLELRARSYLHANCSTCHRFGGGGSVPSFMNIEAPLPEARLVSAKPVQGDLGLPEARIIAPGDPARSVLLYRMTTAGRGHMPYLGGHLVDDRGVMLVRDWIASMPRGEDQASAPGSRRELGPQELAQLNGGDATPIDNLLSSPSGALTVSLAIIDGSLRGKSREEAIRKGSALADPLRRDLFERFLPDEARRKVIGADVQPKTLLALKGDIARGKLLFGGICASCHRLNGEGVDFGPDLSHIGSKHNRAALLEQIATPSKIIEPQWQLTTVVVRNGEPLSGFVEGKNADKWVLKVANGERKEIAAANIESTFVAPVSVMPEGLLQSLTPQEAADLLELLSSLK
jgi:putative heme-binding domain-containing protein